MKRKLLIVLLSLSSILSTFFTQSSGEYAYREAFGEPSDEGRSSAAAVPGTKGRDAGDIKIPDSRKGVESISNYRSNFKNIDVGNNQQSEDLNLVVIDAGHGGSDSGASGNGLVEKVITLDVAQRLNSLLKSTSVQTYMIRTDDRFIDHRDRIELANSKKASLYISIHCDWYKDPSLNGTSTLFYPSRTLAAGGLNELDYAGIVRNELAKALETRNRGTDDRSDLAVLRRANMPSLLIELGFLSNKNDSYLLSKDSFREKAAEALAEGIRKSLDKISSR